MRASSRCLRTATVGLAVLALMTPSAAHAAGGTVSVSYVDHAVPLGTGYVVEVVCEATAREGTSGDTALATVVRCGVNGTYVEEMFVGGKAVTHITAAANAPLSACYGARTTFVQPDGVSYEYTVPDTCVPV